MRAPRFLAALVAPLAMLAASAPVHDISMISARQEAVVKPSPCQPIADITVEETEARFDVFADAFIVKKNITAAFEFINEGYINHNPFAQNGFDSAWSILSPIWSNQTLTPLGTRFISPQGWVNYESGSFGTIVDRFRWEDGCIAEHWDQNETMPALEACIV